MHTQDDDQDEVDAAIEAATLGLESMGLTRRAQGHLFWQMNDEMLGGIRLQARRRADKVEITPVAQVVWLPIEQLVAIGKGVCFRPWSPMAITRSLIQITPPGQRRASFEPATVTKAAADLMVQTEEKVIPQIVDMADERVLVESFKAQARDKVGQALRLVAWQTWERGHVDLDQAFADLMAAQPEARSRARLKQFLERLATSEQTQEVLAGKRQPHRAGGPAAGPKSGFGVG